MRIVIDISEEMYNIILSEEYVGNNTLEYAARCIQDGTQLPKGHGRLIDADKYKSNLIWNENIDNAPTIIEADEEN